MPESLIDVDDTSVATTQAKRGVDDVKYKTRPELDRTPEDVSIDVAGEDWAYCKSDN